MDEVAPDGLLRQMLEELALIGAAPAAQRAWLSEQELPSDELMQQLEDSLFTFTPRLREAGLLGDATEAAVAEVLARLKEIPTRIYRLNHDGLSEPEWEPARRAAARAVDLLASRRSE